MPKNRTPRSCWESSYGANWIATGQYVAEKLCQRKADQEGRGKLAHKFWKTDAWANFYKQQLAFANRLIREFSEAALLKALKRQDTSWCFSLAGQKFRAAVYEEWRRLEAVAAIEVAQQPLKQEIVVEPRPSIIEAPKTTVTANHKNTLNKLDDI